MYMINRCSLLMIIAKIRPLPFEHFDCYNNTDERESHQEAQPAWENSSLGFIEAVHQW